MVFTRETYGMLWGFGGSTEKNATLIMGKYMRFGVR